MNWFLDPTVARVFYAAVMGVVLLLAGLSRSEAMIKLGGWLLMSWLGSNLIFEVAGAREAPFFIAPFNALIVANVANHARIYRSRVSRDVALLFCIELLITFTAYVIGRAGDPLYFVSLNAVFLVRALITGRAGLAAIRLGPSERRPRPPQWVVIDNPHGEAARWTGTG